MIASIIPFGENGNGILICDAKCHKAWGINHRPRIQLSFEEDDYVFVKDSELDDAPDDTDEHEGGDGKPTAYDKPAFHIHNKWCARECERSVTIFPNQMKLGFAIPDLENPRPNHDWRNR